ncbi:MAG: TapB family protein, partial [Blastocatellia bacterium]
ILIDRGIPTRWNRSLRNMALLASVLFAYAIMTSCGGTPSRDAQRNGNAASAQSSAPAGQAAACNNPFYPTSSTAHWQYNANFGSGPLTLTVKRMAIEFGKFTDHLAFSDGLSVDVPWNCTEEGLLCSEFVPVNLRHYQSAFKLQYSRGSGVTLPPVNNWSVGYHWTANFAVSGQRDQSSGPQEASGTVDIDNKIVGSGNVTVPAGTFDAFQVDSTIIETLTIGSGSTTGNTLHVSVKTTGWYAKDVGLIKIAFSGDPGTGGEELTSFTK